MKSAGAGGPVLFEPWSLGDVMIAAAALREMSRPAAIACHSIWHPLVRRALAEIPDLDLFAVDLPYTTRQRANPFDAGVAADAAKHPDVREVLSVRGDLRDFRAAHAIFPRAHIRMKGWTRFFGRKSALVNFPYALGILPVQNRYRSWARLAGVDYAQMEATYRRRQAEVPATNRVVIHVGAQWRSKQFPDVAALQKALREQGRDVIILAGPRDLLPPALEESNVRRVADEALVEALRSAAHVITNDSGPMHVAAFLGCRTTVLVRTSPIEEWAPPATKIIRSPETPRGYRPNRHYMSDEILSGWTPIETVIREIRDANLAMADKEK
ncbi:MAG: glycosyltransferase family 9 protein [Chthoniobacterales bacterium]